MEEKIIQIIPAPKKMRVHYENCNISNPLPLFNKDGKPILSNAVSVIPACLALVELDGGAREIIPVTMDTDGCFTLATYDSHFAAVTND